MANLALDHFYLRCFIKFALWNNWFECVCGSDRTPNLGLILILCICFSDQQYKGWATLSASAWYSFRVSHVSPPGLCKVAGSEDITKKTEAALCSLGETEQFLGESNEISWPGSHCPSGALVLTTYWCLLFWIHVKPRSKVLMTTLWIILSQNTLQSVVFFLWVFQSCSP